MGISVLESMLCYHFLEFNGIHLKFSDEELVDLGLSVASGNKNYEELLDWVRSHALNL